MKWPWGESPPLQARMAGEYCALYECHGCTPYGKRARVRKRGHHQRQRETAALRLHLKATDEFRWQYLTVGRFDPYDLFDEDEQDCRHGCNGRCELWGSDRCDFTCHPTWMEMFGRTLDEEEERWRSR